jgi:hypothetical protein
MSTSSTIADYIQHNRNLGKRFVAEEAILLAFSRSVGKVPLHGIHPAMIATALAPRRSPRSTVCWRASSVTRSRVAG